MKTRHNADRLLMWCPACEDVHQIYVGTSHGWQWDGNTEYPTITPSIKVTGVQWADGPFVKRRHRVPPGGQTVCHSFVRAGCWEFLADCTHDMAGLTVPMCDLPDYLE